MTTAPRISSLGCPPRVATERNRYRSTFGPRVAEVAELLGFTLMPWQRRVADISLEIDPATGELFYREVVLTVPRQSGKTTLELALMAWRCLGFDVPQNVVYTAQDLNHASLKWGDEHVPLILRSPLRLLVDRVRRQRGAEAILWGNGSRHGITAPTENAGHSQVIDLAIADEAWARTDDKLETGLSPAMVTRKSAQLWVVSTAGTPTSSWLRNKVDAGRTAPQGRRTAYFEWSADPHADPADPETWRSCMPALGYTVAEETIQAEYERLERDAFLRSYLNVWSDEAPRPAWAVIGEQGWATCADKYRKIPLRPAFAIDVTPDRSWSTIAAAWTRSDGLTAVEIVEHVPGTRWVPERLAELYGKHSPSCVVLDPGSAAGALIPSLEAYGIGIHKPTVRQVAGSAGTFYDLVLEGALRHADQVPLNAAVAGCTMRPLGDAWTWNRRGSDVVISPLVACSLALWGHQQAPGMQLFSVAS